MKMTLRQFIQSSGISASDTYWVNVGSEQDAGVLFVLLVATGSSRGIPNI